MITRAHQQADPSRTGATTWTQCAIKTAHIVWSLRIDLRKTLDPSILRIRDLFRTRTSHISKNDSKRFGESEVHWTGDFSIYLLANRKFILEGRERFEHANLTYAKELRSNCNTEKFRLL